MTHHVTIRRALISVSDKSGVVELARALHARGVEIISTGGTAKALSDAGIPVVPIEKLTGFPEMMDGRVKTLHPKVHGGLLAVRTNDEHARAMREHSIAPIDLVCINLYPFEQTIAKPNVSREEAIENIDIGGPSMVRSAAKNHEFVAVLTDPSQYARVLSELDALNGATSLELRRELCAAAFALTARYDSAIAKYLARDVGAEQSAAHEHLPQHLTLSYEKAETMRYGENPHQAAALYREQSASGPSVVNARKLHGKELGYNNVADAAAALDLAVALTLQAHNAGDVGVCVIKHANPCGVAIARSAAHALELALLGDPIAAFGGIFAIAGTVDAACATRLCQKDVFAEVIVAQDFAPEALEMLKAKSVNVRLLATGPIRRVPGGKLMMRTIPGGLLVQDRDLLPPNPSHWTHAAGPAPTHAQLHAAAAIEIMVRSMSSNAIAIGAPVDHAVRLLGAGVGQVDRVTACRLAVEKSRQFSPDLLASGIALSDAFFPFPDGPQILIDAGVKMIVHPGGSKRDGETFELCNKHGVTCMTTGVRRFKH
jgi:phosphoribosylaminoimidazolecarboxamide formyltransferase/IMP cyclohydrolase